MRSKKTQNVSAQDLIDAANAKSNKDAIAEKYSKSLKDARASDKDTKLIDSLDSSKTGNWSLRSRILKSPWVKTGNPYRRGMEWMYKVVFKDPKKYQYIKRINHQGGLFTWRYFNPKTKDTLAYWDNFPLVISLGGKVTENGIRNIGFNLHLLPPKIRIIVLCQIFEMYKRLYRFQIFSKSAKPVQINYNSIVRQLDKYSVRFCVRMYIPARQTQVVEIPYSEWDKAIFVPSFGYERIKAQQLIDEWVKYSRKHGNLTNSQIDWKTII